MLWAVERHRVAGSVGRWAGMALVVLAIRAGLAADPTTGRTGELAPGSSAPRTGLTREELIREWDLDGDGTISKPESDVARGRMKRRRLDMQLGSGIDPITGLPRSIDPVDPEAEGDDEGELIFRLPPELPPPPARPQESLPGTRPPKLEVPSPGAPDAAAGPSLPASPTSATPGFAPAPLAPARSGRASWLPPGRMPAAITGGVRAGAPAAASGYGASPWADLNAGRRPAAPLPQVPAISSAPASGGLLPTGRLPGRTGALVLPTLPGQSRAAAAGSPPPTPAPVVPRPRITAEEIGGY